MKRIFIDLEKCYKCSKCTAGCSYFYRTGNEGIEKLLAKAAQYLVCRRCEDAFCIASCPREALEKDEKGILQRHLMRCVSCKSCAIACPFGTIYLEILNYKSSMCDYCAGRCDGGRIPLCAQTCGENAIKYEEVKESEEQNIYLIGENLAVHTYPWTSWKK